MKTRPNYYGGPENTYEAIKVIQAWELGFELGNVVKYVARAGKKHENAIEDLKKARQYLDFEIEKLDKPNVEVKIGCEVKGLESLEKLKINLDKYATPPHVPVGMCEYNYPMHEHLYGHRVKLNDRFESVHIWSKELALKNKGRWKPVPVEGDDIIAMQYKIECPEEIDEGLQRINEVLDDLGVSKENPYPAEQWIQNITFPVTTNSTSTIDGSKPADKIEEQKKTNRDRIVQKIFKDIKGVVEERWQEYALKRIAKDLGVDDKNE